MAALSAILMLEPGHTAAWRFKRLSPVDPKSMLVAEIHDEAFAIVGHPSEIIAFAESLKNGVENAQKVVLV